MTLDWTSNGPDGSGRVGPPMPCVDCGKPAICRSPQGEVVHKTCAEKRPARDGWWPA